MTISNKGLSEDKIHTTYAGLFVKNKNRDKIEVKETWDWKTKVWMVEVKLRKENKK